MNNKWLQFNSEARVSLLKGMDTLAKAVGSTLGPKGQCVIIDDYSDDKPLVTKDGVTVAKSIQLKDINKKFSQIENVFSEHDQLKFGLKNNDSSEILNKSIAGSITFKKIIQKEIWKHEDNKDYKIDVVDNETINNFKEVFEYLTKKINEISFEIKK